MEYSIDTMPDDDEDRELFDLIHEAIARKRQYAGFFHWPDRGVMERGIAQELLDAISPDFANKSLQARARGQGNDPPDCEVELEPGVRIGIEVSELVDQHHAGGSPSDWAVWSPEKLYVLVTDRLSRKDRPSLVKGGPYAKYMLVLFTDEPMLTAATIRQYFDGKAFGPCALIDAAWILTSYMPGELHPHIRLNLMQQDA